MRRAVLYAMSGLFAVVTASAEPAKAPNFSLSNPNAPIDYSADNCDAAIKEGTLVCSGNVVIRQGEVRLRAATVEIHAPNGKSADKIYAYGHVVVDAPSGTATGDNGVYNVNPRLVTLTGHVVLAKEKSVMRGETLTVDLISGKATLEGGKAQGGRVQGLFAPESQKPEKP